MKQQVCKSFSLPVSISPLLLSLFLLIASGPVEAQKQGASKTNSDQTKPVDKLANLRAEFIKATKDYKASLEKLLTFHEKNVRKAEEHSRQSRGLFEQGLISKNDLEGSERAVAEARGKLLEVNRLIASAESEIADTLLEADAATKLAKTKRMPKGGLIRTASLIRYNGSAAWVLSDAWKVQRFFLDAFKRQLPIAAFGQGAIHDRWRLNHHNAFDVSIHPDGLEGQALLSFLRNNSIPFLAFREAIPGTSTGPHIHIGRPSHRY